MAMTARVVAGPTPFTDDTEHSVALTDNVAAGETCVAFIGCSVTDINGIVGYVDANDGAMTTTADCSTQTTWQKDEEFGGAGGGGYRGVSCFSSYIKTGLTSGDTIRFGVKHGSGGTFDASGFYHGQSPHICVIALNSGDGRYMVYDTSDSNNENTTTTPNSPSITTANDSIVLGFFAGATTAGVGWFTPGSGWTELVDSASGTESNFNIACQYRLATTSYSGDSSGTSSVSASFGNIIASYKATAGEPGGVPTILAGTRERGGTDGDFFGSGNTAAFPFVASSTGTSLRMGSSFLRDNSGITTVKLGVYSHDSGNNRPLTLLGSGSVTVNPVNSVAFGATVSGVTINGGTTYWLAYSGAGEQVDIDGLASAGFGREGTGNMVGTWVAGGNMGVKPGIWIESTPTTASDPLAKSGLGIIGP